MLNFVRADEFAGKPEGMKARSEEVEKGGGMALERQLTAHSS